MLPSSGQLIVIFGVLETMEDCAITRLSLLHLLPEQTQVGVDSGRGTYILLKSCLHEGISEDTFICIRKHDNMCQYYPTKVVY